MPKKPIFIFGFDAKQAFQKSLCIYDNWAKTLRSSLHFSLLIHKNRKNCFRHKQFSISFFGEISAVR